MKKLLSVLLVTALLASMSLSAFADVEIQDMPKSNHKIKEVTYYDKNPDPSAEGEMADYPAVWMMYDDPDEHTNDEVFVLKEVLSKDDAANTDLGMDGFRINGKWYKVIGLWTVNPEKDIIDKGKGEKAVFTPIYYVGTEKPASGTTVQVALYDYEANGKTGGISNLVDVIVPEEGKETNVKVEDNKPEEVTTENKEPKDTKTTVSPTTKKSKIFVGDSTVINPNVKNGKNTTTFNTNNKTVATVDKNGKVTGKGAGTAIITVENNGVKGSIKITVIKKTNTVITSFKTLKAKYKKKTIIKNAITVKDAKGKVIFKKKNGNSNIKINSKSGTITVNNRLKRGTYKLKIKVTDKGNVKYKGASKTITVKITVK